MGDPLAEHGVVDVGVGVDVHHADRAVLAGHRPQDRQGDGVVAAHGRRHDVVGEHEVEVGLDAIDRIGQVERVGGHVADVVDAEAVEGRRPRGHVVGTQQYRFGPDVARPVAGTRPVRRAEVEGHADHGDVEVGQGARTRQPHERAAAGESGHLVAAQRLRVGRVGHRGSFRLSGHVLPRGSSRARGRGWHRDRDPNRASSARASCR